MSDCELRNSSWTYFFAVIHPNYTAIIADPFSAHLVSYSLCCRCAIHLWIACMILFLGERFDQNGADLIVAAGNCFRSFSSRGRNLVDESMRWPS